MIQQITLRFAAVDDAAWPGIPEHELHASSLQGLLFQTALPLYSAAEAAWLHEHPSPKPYALAPLYGPGRALRGLRISSWSARATEALLEGWQRVYEQGVVLQLGQRNRFVVEEGRYATAVSFLQLLAPKPRPNMTLHFISPTASRRGPRRLHLPLPANVFARPAQVWQTYAPESLRLPDGWGDWCEQHVMAHTLPDGIGVLRVSMFPGMLGMDVARDMTRAIDEMQCDRLIVDLRGNTGGGIGCLRLMSLLCDDRRGVGYSLGRDALKAGRTKEQLPAFDRIPSSKWGVLPLAIKFARAGRSVAVYTERLGKARHHGRVALLINEHAASAAEMVAAFASEYGLATLVGAKTPGRLVATSAFKVGHGYRVALPVAAYYTWKGTNLEGHGVVPDVEAPLDAEALWGGVDNQLQRAMSLIMN